MSKKDARVDAYIEKSADFAKPILQQLRKIVHSAAPEIEEDIKWGVPFFLYKGPLCHMAAFKQHCAFGFWRGVEVPATLQKDGAMGVLGRLTSVADLPPDQALAKAIQAAVAERNSPGAKSATKPKPKTKAAAAVLTVPDDLKARLAKNKKAATTFENFSPSHRREYIEWITSAKREETRSKRLDTALEWLAEGKSQNWRYEKR
jgi:uncharacterized protein YdeI (YjbR/CyaY-like superfamily)